MTKQAKENIAFWTFRILSILVLGILFWILEFIFVRGWHMLNWDFLTKMPEDGMTKAEFIRQLSELFVS